LAGAGVLKITQNRKDKIMITNTVCGHETHCAYLHLFGLICDKCHDLVTWAENEENYPVRIVAGDIVKAVRLIPGICLAFKSMELANESGYFEGRSYERALNDSSQYIFEAVVTVMTILHPDIAKKYKIDDYYDVGLEDEFEKLYSIDRV
jgi:hypothetical protein